MYQKEYKISTKTIRDKKEKKLSYSKKFSSCNDGVLFLILTFVEKLMINFHKTGIFLKKLISPQGVINLKMCYSCYQSCYFYF